MRGSVSRSLVVLALVAGTTVVQTVGALAQEGPPSAPPTVDILPHGASAETDPNGGEWFVTTGSPGQTKQLQARLTNPAGVPQTVRLYLGDLVYGDDGTPRIPDPPFREVGTWGAFDRPRITIPADTQVVESFSVTVPEGSEPGDWVGVVVVEHESLDGGQLDIVRRVATKLYVTVPGSAPSQFEIQRVEITPDSTIFPREATVTVWLNNTGRIRLQPDVRVNGEGTRGSTLLMTRSHEPYIVTQSIPFWGGPMSLKVEATTQVPGGMSGPARQLRASTFIFPWHLLLLSVVATGLSFGGRWIWRKRGSGRYQALQQDIRRIEKLLAAQASGPGGAPPEQDDDPESAILAAIKQAKRSGDPSTVERLEGKLAELRTEPSAPPDALVAILRELADAPPKRRKALVAAARAYGRQALREHQAVVDELPEEIRMELVGRAPTGKTKPRGKPPKKKR